MIRRTFVVAVPGRPVRLRATTSRRRPPPAPPPPPAPTVVSLTLNASPGVNPDAAGQPKPVRVRVLQARQRCRASPRPISSRSTRISPARWAAT